MLVNNIQYSYLKSGIWSSFSGTSETTMDGIKIQTPKSSPYFLRYRTWNSGKTDWYSRVDSNVDDYAGAPNRPIQRLQIQVYDTNGTKITEKIVVMYRACVAGRWLPWVSNAEPEWMQSVHAKYNLGGTIDTDSYYAGNAGQNMDGIEIRVYEEGILGDFTGGEVGASALQYMVGSLDNWQSFDNSFYAEQIDGIKIQTAANKGYYLQYRTKNEGKSDWYPFVKSTGTAYNDYAGYPGKAIQLLEIQAYKNDGTRLRSGVIVMYRVSIEGRWLPWVSNADAEWMRDMQNKHSLGGTLSVNSTYAGNAGQKIDGVEIRIFEDDTENAGSGGSAGTFPGTESSATLQYMTDSLSNWTSFSGTVLTDHIDGIKIRTDTSKPYYLSYRSWNAGKGQYYPYVDSRGTAYNDYAGYPGKPIQLLNIYAYANDGTKLREGVVVMYRVHVDNRWLPWVSNANPEWMVSVQEKYDLGGTLDTKSTYAGNKGQNINGVEIHIFEENGTGGGTITPVGNYKIIPNVPFISQVFKYPTGCESVSTVMALQYAGVDMTVENFIDNYLDKGSNKSFDPNVCFGGNPYSTSGYGCYSPVIKKALDRILKDSLLYAKEEKGKSIEYLCSEYIDRDIPVIFWATQRMETPRKSTRIPYEGRYIQWISPMHCLLLVGYDDNHYIFNDPQEHALTYYSKEAVETAYAGLFKQAVVILDGSNKLFNRNNYETLKTELVFCVENDLSWIQFLGRWHTSEEALDIVLTHDASITQICNTFGIQKGLLQTVFFREQKFIWFQDDVADTAVVASYNYDKDIEQWQSLSLAEQAVIPCPTKPVIYRHDCSTGLCQIFAATAIKAINFAIDQKIITDEKHYDKNDLKDLEFIWFKLKNDDAFNIKCGVLTLIYEAISTLGYRYDFQNYSNEQIAMLFTKYNSISNLPNDYGKDCAKWYKIFHKYNTN